MELNKPLNLLPENIVNLSAITTDRVLLPAFDNHNIKLDVLRLDKIHPVISGNKWFKLQYYLQDAIQHNKHIITFGGAYSNHIIATASAACGAGLTSTGIIRGEQPAILSHTLVDAMQYGMQLQFISRNLYNQKNDPAFIQQLNRDYQHPCIIPEGGEGETGIKGAAEILQLVDLNKFTHIVCAVGTGTLLTGLLNSSSVNQQVIGIPVLKGFEDWSPPFVSTEQKQRLIIINDYHFGGYAKKNGALFGFMNEWYKATAIPSDFVYTGKLFYAVNDLVQKNFFPEKSRLLVIHSGGLQGNKSLPAKTLDF